MPPNPKGYFTSEGYMGYIPEQNRYMLFASDSDYLEYLEEE